MNRSEQMEQWALALTAPMRHARTVLLFCKGLYVFMLFKIILSWSTFTELAGVYNPASPRSVLAWIIYGAGEWGRHHITAFLVIFTIVLVSALWLRVNYFTAALITWLAVGLSRIAYPASNGADQISIALLFLTIPLSAYPVLTHPIAAVLQRGAYHGARIFGKLYICMIYFVSGADKLGDAAWRSGDAIGHVRELTYMFNPALDAWLPASQGGLQFVAWMTIAFELLFPVLVWFKAMRPWVLGAGVIFHMMIAFMLSLPEFAAVMIISYAIFLADD